MIARRTTALVATMLATAALAGCGGSDDSGEVGCQGSANGGTVVVQGSSTVLVGQVAAGVGSIDVDPDKATAILTLSEGDDPAKVRSVPVTVGTTFSAGGEEMKVVQVCRGSLTIE